MYKLFVVFVIISSSIRADWPVWRGIYGDGMSRETGIMKHWKGKGPAIVWRTPLGGGFSGISAVNGVLYTLFSDAEYEYATAIDAKNGKKIWTKRIGEIYKRGHGNGPRSTPIVDAGKVYVVSAWGEMWCLKAANGKKIWHVNILKKFSANNVSWGVSSSPVIYRDRLLFNVGGSNGKSIVAFNKNTGSVIWKCANDTAGYATPIFATINSVKQAIFFTGRGLLATNIHNGKILWRYDWKTSYQVNAATPIYHKSHIFISSGYNSGAALIRILYKKRKFYPKLVWKSKQMKNHFSSSILYKGYIYGFHNTILSCMEFATGKIMWRQRGFGKGTLVGIDQHIIVLSERGTLALFRMNPHKYKEKGRGYLLKKGKYWTVPTICYGNLYIRNETEIICLSIR